MIIKIGDTVDFTDFINENIARYDYRYKYLINLLDVISNYKIQINATSFINKDDEGWIIFIEVEDKIFLYGLNFSEIQVYHFTQTINLKKYKNFEIMGTMELVYKILKISAIENYKLIKDRCFYQLTNYSSIPTQNQIELANLTDREELIQMFQNYYFEEYNGERNKTAESLTSMIESYIQSESLFVIKNAETITTFCSVDNPDIGIVYTKEQYRGLGLGRRLLEYCSSLLFKKNEVAYLMTDMHNPSSNNITRKIGYELIYEHTNIKL